VTPDVPNPNRVLVIDDSEFIHKLVRVRLRKEGLEVRAEYSGREGLERSLEDVPDLILLDVDLPDMDGFEVCRRLKEHQTTRHIPVIFLTGNVTTEAKVRGLDLGAVDYVTKPFDDVELRARVRAALRTKRLQDILEQQSYLDALTGLWNRAYVEAELKVSARYGRSLGIVIGDIDHFKNLNDTYGHLFGDVVLQSLAEVFRVQARQSDIVTRYGGEEFVLLLTDTQLEGATGLCERLCAAVEQRMFVVRDEQVTVTASFGVTTTEELDGELTPEALLGAADAALYASKQGGRNCIHAKTREGFVRIGNGDFPPGTFEDRETPKRRSKDQGKPTRS
jgi:diguanylate cyclase (GGDEF)-like protein